ncbi:glutathione transferase GstA [Burkholderiaceae bacterium DAT-1]|nr:glutathione transferase GstA [Burkholderiaceae bacterium DAT-1]
MKLYFSPGACSLAVHIALHEAGLKADAVKVDLRSHTLADGTNYYDISPRGYVPLLELDDGSRHSEASALLQYVADQVPEAGLIGEVRSLRRLEVTKWVGFISTELHKTFGPLWNPATLDAVRAQTLDRLATRLKDVNAHLATTSYLAGDYSIADAYAFTVINWANFLSIPLADYPHIQDYMARIAARPAVQAALAAEGLNK